MEEPQPYWDGCEPNLYIEGCVDRFATLQLIGSIGLFLGGFVGFGMSVLYTKVAVKQWLLIIVGVDCWVAGMRLVLVAAGVASIMTRAVLFALNLSLTQSAFALSLHLCLAITPISIQLKDRKITKVMNAIRSLPGFILSVYALPVVMYTLFLVELLTGDRTKFETYMTGLRYMLYILVVYSSFACLFALITRWFAIQTMKEVSAALHFRRTLRSQRRGSDQAKSIASPLSVAQPPTDSDQYLTRDEILFEWRMGSIFIISNMLAVISGTFGLLAIYHLIFEDRFKTQPALGHALWIATDYAIGYILFAIGVVYVAVRTLGILPDRWVRFHTQMNEPFFDSNAGDILPRMQDWHRLNPDPHHTS